MYQAYYITSLYQVTR